MCVCVCVCVCECVSLTQWFLSVHSLDVHQAGQVGADSDGIGPGGLVCPLDTAALPVRPVDVRAQQGEAVRVLDGRHQGPPVLSVQVGRLYPLDETENTALPSYRGGLKP